MYRHIKKYEFKYTDGDAYDNLKPSALFAVLQESACHSADELGFGYEVIKPKNVGFVIANWYLELNRRIKFNEALTIHTWPLKPRHLIFLRDFEIYSGDEKVGIATSRWCMVDLNKFSMLPINSVLPPDFFDNYNTERCTLFSDWKIPAQSSCKASYSRELKFYDCDHYFHVNNTRYPDLLLDAFSAAELKDKWISSVQISYVKQCKEGETLTVYREDFENYSILEGRVDGELRVQMRVKLNGI